jgi:hypothetical protein
MKDSLTAKRVRRTQVAVEMARGFDERFDVFWAALSQATHALLAVRDREALKWHFAAYGAAGNPSDALWILTVSKGTALEAYGIFQRRDEPRFGLKRMRLVDFQALRSHEENCEAILRRALDQCKAQGIHVLEQVGSGLPKTEVIDRTAPYRRRLEAWSFYFSADNPELAESLANASAWEPSSYDGDASL